MIITFANRKPNPYTNSKGNKTLVYEVDGTKEELAAYKKSKGEFYREDKDTKKVLFFTTRFVGKKCQLSQTSKGEFVPDTTELDILHNAEQQFGWNIARQMTGNKTESAPAED